MDDGRQAIPQRGMDGFNAADVDALVALYEPDATMVVPDGIAVGHNQIRENWAGLCSPGATMQLTTRYCLVNGDLALLRNDYLVTAPGLEFAGSTSEVVRRQPD